MRRSLAVAECLRGIVVLGQTNNNAPWVRWHPIESCVPAHGRLEEVIGVHARVPGTHQGKRLPGGGILEPVPLCTLEPPFPHREKVRLLAFVCDLPVTLWALVRECLSPQWFFSFFRGKKKYFY